MDDTLQIICRKINIDGKRELYTKTFDTVRKTIVDGLKQNEIFKVLCCDLSLCGSYPDNLKISKPNEFDLVMRLQFPHNDQVIIIADKTNRGNVIIDLSKVIQILHAQKNDTMHKFLLTMVNEKKYFLQNSFQSWLEGRVTKLIQMLDAKIIHCNKMYALKYHKQGPAHTIVVFNEEMDFAIDFVPGFRFNKSKSISLRKLTCEYWEAIPRPIKGIPNNPSFRTSYTESERNIFKNLNQFKNTLRLMKKFRDMDPKLDKLKSYFLKTFFMLYVNEANIGLWNKSITFVLRTMFERLENVLKDQKINYLWDSKLNLLQDLKPSQIDSMYHVVKRARKTLMSPTCTQDILNLFLTAAEQMQLPIEDQQITQDKPVILKDRKVIQEEFQFPTKAVCATALVMGVAFGLWEAFCSRDNN